MSHPSTNVSVTSTFAKPPWLNKCIHCDQMKCKPTCRRYINDGPGTHNFFCIICKKSSCGKPYNVRTGNTIDICPFCHMNKKQSKL